MQQAAGRSWVAALQLVARKEREREPASSAGRARAGESHVRGDWCVAQPDVGLLLRRRPAAIRAGIIT